MRACRDDAVNLQVGRVPVEAAASRVVEGPCGGPCAASVGAVVPLSDLLRAVEKAGTDFQQTEESGGR